MTLGSAAPRRRRDPDLAHNWHRGGSHLGEVATRSARFLPWHRLYLHFFEQVVERLIGEPFALPYWNYLDPNLRDMLLPFRARLEADGSENPLFYLDRNPLTRDPDDPSVPASEKPSSETKTSNGRSPHKGRFSSAAMCLV
jgi:tyrosinase